MADTLSEVRDAQQKVCVRFGAQPEFPDDESVVGISVSALDGGLPLHGLRHPPEGRTCGWYIWSGEMSDDGDSFKALHVAHLAERCAAVLPYLGLPQGWRFLIAPRHEDVWWDATLLEV